MMVEPVQNFLQYPNDQGPKERASEVAQAMDFHRHLLKVTQYIVAHMIEDSPLGTLDVHFPDHVVIVVAVSFNVTGQGVELVLRFVLVRHTLLEEVYVLLVERQICDRVVVQKELEAESGHR